MRTRRRGGRALVALVVVVAGLTGAVTPTTRASAATPVSHSIARLGPGISVVADAAGHVTLLGISCPSARRCVAVGADGSGRAVVTAGERGTGTLDVVDGDRASGRARWQRSAHGRELPDDVDLCRGGHGRRRAGTRRPSGCSHRTGWRWATPTAVVPDGAGGGSLAGVNCPTASTCIAVGTDADAQGIVTTGLHVATGWSWSMAVAVTPDSSGSGRLTAVSCGSSGDLRRRRHETRRPDGIATSGVARDGVWTWSAAVRIGAATDTLSGVSCASAAWCVAVGDDASARGVSAIGAQAAGTWTWQPAESLGQLGSVAGVSCPSTRLCLAVGSTSGRTRHVRPVRARPPRRGSASSGRRAGSVPTRRRQWRVSSLPRAPRATRASRLVRPSTATPSSHRRSLRRRPCAPSKRPGATRSSASPGTHLSSMAGQRSRAIASWRRQATRRATSSPVATACSAATWSTS